jgi:hypothetical protein
MHIFNVLLILFVPMDNLKMSLLHLSEADKGVKKNTCNFIT